MTSYSNTLTELIDLVLTDVERMCKQLVDLHALIIANKANQPPEPPKTPSFTVEQARSICDTFRERVNAPNLPPISRAEIDDIISRATEAPTQTNKPKPTTFNF